MRYELEVIINLPRKKVVELFDNPDNLSKWQEGLISFTHKSGEPGKPGAQSKIVYQMGKRRIEMLETITKRNLPYEFSGTYEAPGMWNLVENFFIERGDGTTLFRTRHTFECKTLLLKIMAFVNPGAFKKQSLKYMQDFKRFAESV